MANDEHWMRRALELAALGCGAVEPNPLVGCVVVRNGVLVGEGYHQQFGGPHAEVHALAAAGERARGATLYVTLEPCCHWGKTPPCTDALLAAGVARVVVAQVDPFREVAGRGLDILRAAGIAVSVGVLAEEAQELNAAYLKLTHRQLPWIIAKWAMTWDGKLASRNRDSRWISHAASRALVHRWRGQVDVVAVGIGTALADDPQLTARPPGPRLAKRLVVDWQAQLPLHATLVKSSHDVPVWLAVSEQAAAEKVSALQAAGCEILVCCGPEPTDRLQSLLLQLGKRRITNVMVEGGSGLLGQLLDQQAIDEVRVFLGPSLLGGRAALSPLGGLGLATMAEAASLRRIRVEQIEQDVLLMGRVDYANNSSHTSKPNLSDSSQPDINSNRAT